MKIEQLYKRFLECSQVTTDTRNIAENSMFFALKGERFDANEFAKEALEKGAKYAVIDNSDYAIENRTLLVDNVLIALQELANYHRKQLTHLKIIGLTGSNGKTTTKELLNVVLSKKYNTKATIGNLNNHIGVPLTLLAFDKTTEIGIVEMGANHQKEIEFLCGIAEPDYGYITNFGKAHLEGFGGVEGIIKGKSELYQYLEANSKTAIVNLDDNIQREKTKNLKRYTFCSNSNCDVKIDTIDANPMVKITFENTTIQSNLIGLYNANNINAAITFGKYFNVSNMDIQNAIENYYPTNNRSQILKKNTNKIILDAYNANPSSMQAALINFIQLPDSSKTAILGDMFELGEESEQEHQIIVEICLKQPEVQFYFIGKHFYTCRNLANEKTAFFEDFDTFKDYFKNNLPKESLLLIKGSRGMSLERTLEIL
jgi:UDP-N-acetylmuramoyl-tripeptide--D-alanyl-D-alanine ligase